MRFVPCGHSAGLRSMIAFSAAVGAMSSEFEGTALRTEKYSRFDRKARRLAPAGCREPRKPVRLNCKP